MTSSPAAAAYYDRDRAGELAPYYASYELGLDVGYDRAMGEPGIPTARDRDEALRCADTILQAIREDESIELAIMNRYGGVVTPYDRGTVQALYVMAATLRFVANETDFCPQCGRRFGGSGFCTVDGTVTRKLGSFGTLGSD